MKVKLDDLYTKDRETIEEFLKNIWSKEMVVSEDFNWLGLAQVAAQNAQKTKPSMSQDAQLKWAEIAVNVYEYLATQKNVQASESYTLSAMYVRAAMIRQFGSVMNHPILDVRSITQWFSDWTASKREEIVAQLPNWQTLSIAQMRELRQIKNRLSLLELLMEDGHLEEEEALRKWVSIKNELP